MANTYLKRTNGTPTNAQKGTFSAWVKRAKVGAYHRILMNYLDGNNYSYFRIHSGDYIQFYGVSGGSAVSHFKTNRLFRDTNGWFHIMLVVDTTQSTASDRIKIYVNGVQETSFLQADYPNQNINHPMFIASGSNYHTVGSAENGTDCWDGVMSHVHYCDGTALAPTVFGSTDSVTGEWSITTSPSFTLGNNGYTILKDGNTITDQSSNSNDFTLGAGTLTKTEDCPSNVFATMNPLQFNSSGEYFTNGNNTLVSHGGGSWTTHYGFSTLAMGSGKYYVEMKANNTGTSGQSYPIGLIDAEQTITSSLEDNGLASIRASSGNIVGSSFTNQTGLTAISAGDILAIAYDGVNGTLQFYRNGSAHGTAITGIDTSKDYYIACDTYEGASNFDFNFGKCRYF